MTEFTRKFEIIPGYDLTRPPPKRNFGIHNAVARFTVIGIGAVTLELGTGWYVASCYPNNWGPEGKLPKLPQLFYCSTAPFESEQEPSKEPCPYLGCRCYGRTPFSSYAAEWCEPLVAGGTDWLWPKLEELHNHVFLKGPAPDLTPVYRKHPDDKE